MSYVIKRVYQDPAQSDGFRVLVDRVWPRGVSKQAAALDLWFKDVAPSTELRRWYGHDPDKFEEFAKRYRSELDGSDALRTAKSWGEDHGKVTLLYGAKEGELSQAAVLRDLLGG